jgi:SAM-dependent methyltransferase/DNA-binding HxlR family transcriptional regulator
VTPRALLALLFHADKALDLVIAARDMGVIGRLDAGPVSLGALARELGVRPLRMYKLLDGLESLGLVERDQDSDELEAARYVSRDLAAAVDAVLGEQSIERDRNTYPWRDIHGRLPEVLAGTLDAKFEWPPATPDDVRGFEASMAAGCGPIIEALVRARSLAFGAGKRWLDVGGGDGTVAAALLRRDPELRADVLNLPTTEALIRERARESGTADRLGFVPCDFLDSPLPRGYDTLSFIRVLHDWPADVARALLAKAREALAPGARLVVCEEFRTPDRLAIQFFWTYFLVGVDACVSRLREVAWYTDALVELGFVDIHVIPGAFDMVVATRGAA